MRITASGRVKNAHPRISPSPAIVSIREVLTRVDTRTARSNSITYNDSDSAVCASQTRSGKREKRSADTMAMGVPNHSVASKKRRSTLSPEDNHDTVLAAWIGSEKVAAIAIARG